MPSYSAAGHVDAPLRAVGDGCEAADFAALQPGEVAFTGFGTCFLWRKAVNARRAGASALIAQTSSSKRGVASATLAVPRLGLPVALMSTRIPARDGDRVQLTVNAKTRPARTENVIAEIGPRTGRVAMAGAHLDSVPTARASTTTARASRRCWRSRKPSGRGRRAGCGWRSGAPRRRG